MLTYKLSKSDMSSPIPDMMRANSSSSSSSSTDDDYNATTSSSSSATIGNRIKSCLFSTKLSNISLCNSYQNLSFVCPEDDDENFKVNNKMENNAKGVCKSNIHNRKNNSKNKKINDNKLNNILSSYKLKSSSEEDLFLLRKAFSYDNSDEIKNSYHSNNNVSQQQHNKQLSINKSNEKNNSNNNSLDDDENQSNISLNDYSNHSKFCNIINHQRNDRQRNNQRLSKLGKKKRVKNDNNYVGVNEEISTQKKQEQSLSHSMSSSSNPSNVTEDELLKIDNERINRAEKLKRLSKQYKLSKLIQYETKKRTNIVKIHVYDLIAKDVVYPLTIANSSIIPDCNFPIGQCFNILNDGMHVLGTGAYHVGVEVNGIEYAYGSNTIPNMSGIFTCLPKCSPGYQYRTTIDFGKRDTVVKKWIPLPDPKYVNNTKMKHNNIPCIYKEIETFQDGSIIMQNMSDEYMGIDYDLLRRNCCTFAYDASIRLGIQHKDIPNWFLSLCQNLVDFEDTYLCTDASNASTTNKGSNKILCIEDKKEHENGFELILKQKKINCSYDVIKIVENNDDPSLSNICNGKDKNYDEIVHVSISANAGTNTSRNRISMDCFNGLRQTLSWSL